ncbi:MAG: NAD(P)-dependent glycerol-3-phosphate dehydrogenase [Deltaproteobacteria bacterium]|nr:NAD(P)-dependent glycerol-3-phosphate dehydrogenase [Deltaproteobacteria bacterium]
MTKNYDVTDVRKVAVVGAGSWGTALACHLGIKGVEVDLWSYELETANQIDANRENKTYLPGIKIPENVKVFTDIKEVVRNQAIVFLVVPSHVMRPVVKSLADVLSPGVILVSAAKGIENQTLMTMSRVIKDVLPSNLAVHRACLSGPSFARDVGQGLPMAITIACPDKEAAVTVQNILFSPTMRVYTSRDLIGVELGGSMKNIYAIAAGISDGLGLGTSARAALITRGLAEMTRLGVKLGANPLTFMGLAGMGDLVLTCTGDLSRNRNVGLKLGQGRKLKEILAEMKMVAEGVKTTKSVYDLSRLVRVDMPVTEQVYLFLYENKELKQGLSDLMTRALKDEIDQDLTD